jgi:hypothetical protein
MFYFCPYPYPLVKRTLCMGVTEGEREEGKFQQQQAWESKPRHLFRLETTNNPRLRLVYSVFIMPAPSKSGGNKSSTNKSSGRKSVTLKIDTGGLQVSAAAAPLSSGRSIPSPNPTQPKTRILSPRALSVSDGNLVVFSRSQGTLRFGGVPGSLVGRSDTARIHDCTEAHHQKLKHDRID